MSGILRSESGSGIDARSVGKNHGDPIQMIGAAFRSVALLVNMV